MDLFRSDENTAAADRPDRRVTTLPTVTVVVPVHNEAGYLVDAIPRLLKELEAVAADCTVLVVENGSTDDTAVQVSELVDQNQGLRLLQLPHANYGAAIRHGFINAATDWVVSFDIDYFSGPFLASALEQQERADIVVGSKRAVGSQDQRSWFRRTATWQLNLLLRMILGLKVSDTHGMKAIRTSVLDVVLDDVVSSNDLFDTELVLRAERCGFRVVELPVVVVEERESKSRLWTRVPRTISGIWKIRRAL